MSTTASRPPWFYRFMMSFIGLFDRWLHLSCRSFTQLASEKHERKLSAMERFRQALHRMMCGMCRLAEKRLDRIHSLTHDIGHDHQDEVLSAEARERIRQAMDETEL